MTQIPTQKYEPSRKNNFFFFFFIIIFLLPYLNYLISWVGYSGASYLRISMLYSWLPFIVFIVSITFIGIKFGKGNVYKTQTHREVTPEPQNQSPVSFSLPQNNLNGGHSSSGDAWRYVLLTLAFIAFIYFMFKEEIDRLLFI